MVLETDMAEEKIVKAKKSTKPTSFNSIAQKMNEILKDLPQAELIDEDRKQAWIISVLDKEKDRGIWHAHRLFGLGGSEIGVIIGYNRGDFHPFDTPQDIFKRKLMLEGLTATNGHLERGTIMEPIVKKRYLEKIKKDRGAVSILKNDLLKIISEYRNEEHPWLVGNPDDIIQEENGDVYIVDYKVPMPDGLVHILNYGCPPYYTAQLHHYKKILDDLYEQGKIPFKIKGLKLIPFDLATFNGIEVTVEYQPSLVDEILKTGDKFWNEYVLKNVSPPFYKFKETTVLDDLEIILTKEDAQGNLIEVSSLEVEDKRDIPEEEKMLKVTASNVKNILRDQIEKNYLFAQAAASAEKQRSSTADTIAQVIPPMILNDPYIEYIENMGVKIRIKRNHNVDKLIEIVKKISRDQDLDWKNIEEILEKPENKTELQYDMKKLRKSLKEKYDVDLNDENVQSALSDAVVEKGQYRVDFLIGLIRNLDPNGLYQKQVSNTIEKERTAISVIMPRDSGLLGEKKEIVRQEFTQDYLNDFIDGKGSNIIRDRRADIETVRIQKEQEAKEKAEKKAAREKAKAEKAEKAAIEKAEKEKAKAEKAERIAREKAEKEAKKKNKLK